MLLSWHRLDPVSTKERLRNNAVYSLQSNRNPYIDSPNFVECIWGNANCSSSTPPPTSGVATTGSFMSSLQIGPVPADGQLAISWNGMPSGTTLTLELLDAQGRTVGTNQTTGSDATFDTRDLASGVYMLRTRSSFGIRTDKILVQHRY
jgi:hypothetical protein